MKHEENTTPPKDIHLSLNTSPSSISDGIVDELIKENAIKEQMGKEMYSKREMIEAFNSPASNDMWAEAALFKWANGREPSPNDKEQAIDVVKGLKNMANGLMNTDPRKMPTPHEICSVLYYVANNLSDNDA